MRIGILGGTGKEGAGLALRWAQADEDRSRIRPVAGTDPEIHRLMGIVASICTP